MYKKQSMFLLPTVSEEIEVTESRDMNFPTNYAKWYTFTRILYQQKENFLAKEKKRKLRNDRRQEMRDGREGTEMNH